MILYIYILHCCSYYYSSIFYFLNVFSHFEHILILMLIFFFKKNNFIIIVAPINSLNFIDAINLNLLNGIMNIHPCIYLCIFINLLSVYFSFLKSKKMSLDTTLYCFMILLFLGSFWAAQELS